MAHHVEHVRLDVPGDGALQAFVSGVVSTLLDTERPLWRIIVIDRGGAWTTLLVRIHHAVADGFALLGVLLSLIFWVPHSGRMGLGISIFSYAGGVTIGGLADAGLVPEPEALVADLHAEFAALEAVSTRSEQEAHDQT